MELGEKILQARLSLGLSQRQLCGEEITRNMLSQIEHGTASPSMKTLRYLAARLGRPISYFLEEDALSTPNQKTMESARAAFDTGDYAAAAEALEGYQAPDPIFDRELQLLEARTFLALAEEALEQGREMYGAELLEQVEEGGFPELRRRKLLLSARITGADLQEICKKLPSLDEELFIRARAALENGTPDRVEHLLEAMEERDLPQWYILRGKVWLAREEYRQAAACFHKAEEAYPEETAKLLEQCYVALDDIRMAYFYACKQKK